MTLLFLYKIIQKLFMEAIKKHVKKVMWKMLKIVQNTLKKYYKKAKGKI